MLAIHCLFPNLRLVLTKGGPEWALHSINNIKKHTYHESLSDK